MKDYGIFIDQGISRAVKELLDGYLNSKYKVKFNKINYSKVFNLYTSQMPYGGMYEFYLKTQQNTLVGSIYRDEFGIVIDKNY